MHRFLYCFFFKQKTAYEMRISDWSSDVCSSDLKNRRMRPIGWPKKWRPEKGDSSIGRILENTAWLLGGKGVGALLSFVYLAIITRTLGPAGFGHFALILSTAQVISIIVSFESWQDRKSVV